LEQTEGDACRTTLSIPLLTSDEASAGVHPKVISDLLGHSKVNLAMDVYDRTDAADFVGPLTAVSNKLVSNGINSQIHLPMR